MPARIGGVIGRLMTSDDSRKVQWPALQERDPKMSEGGQESIDESSMLASLSRELAERVRHHDTIPKGKHWLVGSSGFQLVICSLVLLNALLMGVEADYPDLELTWTICEHFFTTAFLVEMMMKIYFLGLQGYVEDKGNWLDGFLVVLAVIDTWVISSMGLDVDTQSFSVLRVLRLARVARVVRIFKQFRRFMLILSGIADAMKTTTWVGALICACIYVCAIFCTDFIGNSNPQAYPGYTIIEQEIDESEVMQNFNPYVSFGSMTRSMLTLFNILILTEWTEVVRPVYQKQPYAVIFFIGFALIVTYGVMNVIIGMIVDNVMQNAREMEKLGHEQETSLKLQQLQRIESMVREMDKHGKGHITLADLTEGMRLPGMRELLQNVNTPTGMTGEELLSMLDDDGDGHLLFNEIVRGFYRLIDSDTFQRHCLFQMGINQVKSQTLANSKHIAAMMHKIGNLERVMMELSCEIRTAMTDPSQQRLTKKELFAPAKHPQEDTSTQYGPDSFPSIGEAIDSQNPVYTEKVEDCVVAEGGPTLPGARLEMRVASALERAQLCGNEQSRAAASLCMPELLKELQLSLESMQSELESQIHRSVDKVLESYGAVGQLEERQPSLAGRGSHIRTSSPFRVMTPPVELSPGVGADNQSGRASL